MCGCLCSHTHIHLCARNVCVYVVMYEYGSLSLSKSISVAFGGRRWEISVACVHVGECGTQGMCHKTQPLPIIFYESQLNFISMGASSPDAERLSPLCATLIYCARLQMDCH